MCELTYISHVTGHGLLKLMRPPKQLTLSHRAPAAGAAGAGLPRGAGGHGRAGGVLDVQHGLRLRALLPRGRRREDRARSASAWASTRWSPDASRRGPGRCCWSPSACASRGIVSSCQSTLPKPQVEALLFGMRERNAQICGPVCAPERAPSAARSNLNASRQTDKVCVRYSPLFPREAAGDLDVAGPAWLRSYPDRGGPVHQTRERT